MVKSISQRKGQTLGGDHTSYAIRHSPNSGFSLLEIVLAMAIFLLLLGSTLAALNSFRSRGDIDRASSGTMSLLRLAHERTIAAENNLQWGVHVESDALDLFSGDTYISAAEVFQLPQGTTAQAALSGGGSDVVFNRIDGTTATNGTITLTTNQGEIRTVTIFVSGEASLSGSLPAQQNTRITDTRHAHLALPFSLNSSTTMNLTFSNSPNPDTVQAIDVQANISNGQFTWEGEVDVNGSTQRIALVTHAIGVTTTNLAVRRDKLENDKALTIDVDGTVIATYTADGALTPGVGVTATVQ